MNYMLLPLKLQELSRTVTAGCIRKHKLLITPTIDPERFRISEMFYVWMVLDMGKKPV